MSRAAGDLVARCDPFAIWMRLVAGCDAVACWDAVACCDSLKLDARARWMAPGQKSHRAIYARCAGEFAIRFDSRIIPPMRDCDDDLSYAEQRLQTWALPWSGLLRILNRRYSPVIQVNVLAVRVHQLLMRPVLRFGRVGLVRRTKFVPDLLPR
jgi:hypothetical protein